MEIENLISTKSREDLRKWLQENGKTKKSCWVLISMTPTPNRLLYLDVVEFRCQCTVQDRRKDRRSPYRMDGRQRRRMAVHERYETMD
ncbi:hypothetical protein KCTCHS21_50660 [Cohnella abietis]|uniref:Uncharacterized protein n=1 Tax=Cohnella abietis TaxID=2507935 RepID=A0A3T1DC42_9BACL|nr:hypothetical protein KCTCHS21_50660 [Cohnella abietis]